MAKRYLQVKNYCLGETLLIKECIGKIEHQLMSVGVTTCFDSSTKCIFCFPRFLQFCVAISQSPPCLIVIRPLSNRNQKEVRSFFAAALLPKRITLYVSRMVWVG